MEMDDCPGLCGSVNRASACSKKEMGNRLSNHLPNGMVIPQLRFGVFFQAPPVSLVSASLYSHVCWQTLLEYMILGSE